MRQGDVICEPTTRGLTNHSIGNCALYRDGIVLKPSCSISASFRVPYPDNLDRLLRLLCTSHETRLRSPAWPKRPLGLAMWVPRPPIFFFFMGLTLGAQQPGIRVRLALNPGALPPVGLEKRPGRAQKKKTKSKSQRPASIPIEVVLSSPVSFSR